MPELPPCKRNLACSSKSPAVPFQIRNVLVGILPSVCPTMAPSLTLQNFGLPSQPERSLPLKSDWNSSARTGAATARRTRAVTERRDIGSSYVRSGGSKGAAHDARRFGSRCRK